MRYLPSNEHSGISKAPQVSSLKQLGSRAYVWETTSHGPSSTSRISTSFFLVSEYTHKGHMRNQRQDVRSTKLKETSPIIGTSSRAEPIMVDYGAITALGLNRRKISPIRGTRVSTAQIPAEIEIFFAIEKIRHIFIATYNPR